MKFIFEYFSRICREYSSVLKILREYIYDVALDFILRVKNGSDKIFRENQNTRFMLNNCPRENREIMWKNTGDSGRPQMRTCRMPIACWIPEAADTHSEYVTLISFLAQQWLRERD